MITGKNRIGFKLSAKGIVSFRTFNSFLNKENDILFFDATIPEMEEAVSLANMAFEQFQHCSGLDKQNFFNALENELVFSKKEILAVYCLESGLSAYRAENEFNRTLNQIRQYISVLNTYEWTQPSIHTALKDNALLKADIRKMNIGLGPVVVFGASNFPLAYSTIGGDTISAFAAGCPVIVKSHPMHAGTGELVASVIQRAIQTTGLPEGLFSNLNGSSHDVGAYLVKHPLVKAVAFTGSSQGGRAMLDLAAGRADPIPVFAEMGSLNPVVIDNRNLTKNSEAWARVLAESITNDGGQFCTKPGLIFIKEGDNVDQFVNFLTNEVKNKGVQMMVHPSLKSKVFRQIVDLSKTLSMDLPSELSGSAVEPLIISVSANEFLANVLFHQEFFGPCSFIVKCKTDEELLTCLESLQGQLTASIFVDEELHDRSDVKKWIRIFQNKAGRINLNHAPTGVRVCSSMHHGGTYPAASDSRFGAVGTDAVQRFIRPVCFQNFPDALLPDALKDKNPLKILRRINGELSFAEIIR